MINWPVEILDNKYTRWYQQIVFRAQERTLPKDHYVEIHHIIPRSLGGDNSKSNLASLTAREHFLCHWLLTKILPLDSAPRGKMIIALLAMRMNNVKHHKKKYSHKITGRVFESIRIEAAQTFSKMYKGRPGIPKTEEQKRKHSELITGRKASEETKRKQSLALKGKLKGPLSKEAKRKIGDANRGNTAWNTGMVMSEEFRKKVSEGHKGQVAWNKGLTGYSTSKKGKKYPGSHSEEACLKKRGVKKDPASYEHQRKPIVTPAGIFPSNKHAEDHYGFELAYWRKKKPKEFYYITKGEYILLTGRDI